MAIATWSGWVGRKPRVEGLVRILSAYSDPALPPADVPHRAWGVAVVSQCLGLIFGCESKLTQQSWAPQTSPSNEMTLFPTGNEET